MRAIAVVSPVVAMCGSNRALAEDAKGLSFILTPAKKPAVYRVGEQIAIDASVSAHGRNFCFIDYGGWVRDRMFGRQSGDEIVVRRADGRAADPSAVYDHYFNEADFNSIMYYGGGQDQQLPDASYRPAPPCSVFIE